MLSGSGVASLTGMKNVLQGSHATMGKHEESSAKLLATFIDKEENLFNF